MNKSTTSAEAMVDGTEFYLEKGEIKFMIDGVPHMFCDISVDKLTLIRQRMESDLKVMKGLCILGIENPVEQIKQFIYCQFGNFDNKADISSNDEFNSEYWDCGNRPCPSDGLICKLPSVKNGSLTPHEAQLIREVSSNHSNKMVAATFNRSKLTIDTEMRTIKNKIGCFTKAGICTFAGQHNLV